MTDELLAYLMDDLSPECRAKVEQKLAQDPAWREELDRLKACLAENADPCQCIEEPPCDLVSRTCTLVEHACHCPDRGSELDSETPHDPPRKRARRPAVMGLTAGAAAGGSRSRWTFADWTVGGSAVLILGCLFAPALLESRDASRGLVCQDNLRWLGSQLFSYAARQTNHELPPVSPGEHAGIFAVRLVASGVDPQEMSRRILCPNSAMAAEVCAGRVRLVIPTEVQLAIAKGIERAKLMGLPAGSYAIRIGRFDAQDNFHLPRYTGGDVPLLADEPDLSRAGWASSNHRGGQYVLAEDMNARFSTLPTRAGTGDDIFRNASGEHAAACSPDDTVLSRPDYGPTGPIVPVSLSR